MARSRMIREPTRKMMNPIEAINKILGLIGKERELFGFGRYSFRKAFAANRLIGIGVGLRLPAGAKRKFLSLIKPTNKLTQAKRSQVTNILKKEAGLPETESRNIALEISRMDKISLRDFAEKVRNPVKKTKKSA